MTRPEPDPLALFRSLIDTYIPRWRPSEITVERQWLVGSAVGRMRGRGELGGRLAPMGKPMQKARPVRSGLGFRSGFLGRLDLVLGPRRDLPLVFGPGLPRTDIEGVRRDRDHPTTAPQVRR
jgi:hypothetical protein